MIEQGCRGRLFVRHGHTYDGEVVAVVRLYTGDVSAIVFDARNGQRFVVPWHSVVCFQFHESSPKTDHLTEEPV